MGDFVHTWSGEASQWECDDLGHLNMRHYLYKIAQARQMLGLLLGLTSSFKKDAHSTFRVREFHIRYLGEARPGAPLRVQSAITDLRKTDMDMVHIMYHFDGRPACSVSERVDHISTRTQDSFPWPSRVREAAQPYIIPMPEIAKSKGIDLTAAPSLMSEQDAITGGMQVIGKGVFRPDETDIWGRVPPQALLGRVTETVGQFTTAWPEMFESESLSGNRPINGAILEGRMILGSPPEAGDGYTFYSGIKDAGPNVRALVHKLYNVVSGDLIASMQGVGCLMDLEARKHVKTPQDTIDRLNVAAVPGLAV